MRKNIVYWLVSIIFYVIYFLIFKYTIGNLFPISPMSNFIIIFVLTIINIPLSIFSTEKLFLKLEKSNIYEDGMKNMVNLKKPKFYLIGLALLILIFTFIGLQANFKKDSKYYAKEFLEIVTDPEELESTKYFRDVFYSGGPGQYSIEEYGDLLIKDYGYLMTNRAYENAVSNRFIPWAELIREDTNYKIEVDSIDLVKMKVYDDGRAHYVYLLSLSVFFDNGENEVISVSGDIVMIEEDERWLVDAFRWNSDYQDLNKLLFPHPKAGDVMSVAYDR